MSKDYNYDHYKSVPDPASNVNFKKKKPKLISVVDEDTCTGCQVCGPFCPVDCIDMLPVAPTKQTWKWQLDAIPVTQID